MLEFWLKLLSPDGFPPRWQCGEWSDGLGWLHILSDLAIWLAYFAIPVILGFHALRRIDLPFRKVVLLFGAFIILCGLTHLMNVVIFWWPIYRFDGLLKFMTAVVSGFTVVALFRISPQIMKFTNPAVLEREIAERTKIEAELRTLQQSLEKRFQDRTAEAEEIEKRFRNAFDNAPIGMALVAVDGRFLKVNQSMTELVGYSEAELLATNFQSITHPDDLDTDLNYVQKLFDGSLANYQKEKRYYHKSGRVIFTELSVSLVRDSDGKPAYTIKQIQDITNRKLAESHHDATEKRFRSVFEATPSGLILVSRNGNIELVNELIVQMFGWEKSELIGQPVENLLPERFRSRHPAFRDSYFAAPLERPMGQGRDLTGKRKSGTEFPVEVGIRPVDMAGELFVLASVVDISSRKKSEQIVNASLREKEVLLKEIHHRVKNNLQIVSTLLDLQSGHTKDRPSKEMFQESRGRVKSMALIHERLYRSQDMSHVDFAVYTRQLTHDLFVNYKVSDDDIRLDLDIDIPALTIDIAIPCGLLLNELLSNCLKHAFANRTNGHIQIGIHRIENVNQIIVKDDGAGFPAGTDFRNTDSFGMQLVNTLVEQLGGEIELKINPGTTFIIRFPNTNS